ncbi:MAG: hypothetical protein ACLQDY_12870 [Streptosporangiaceae bacterium]
MSRRREPDSRVFTASTSFSEAEAAAVDAARGDTPMGTFLREVVLAALAEHPRKPARRKYLPGAEPAPPVRKRRDQSRPRPSLPAPYRPFHAVSCAARAESVPLDACTCGGLADGAWEPGDGPAAPAPVVFTPPAEREVS